MEFWEEERGRVKRERDRGVRERVSEERGVRERETGEREREREREGERERDHGHSHVILNWLSFSLSHAI